MTLAFFNTIYWKDIQLEEGTIATNYEPYYNIEYCKIGDYAYQIFKNTTDSEFYDSTLELNEWYLKKNIEKYIFNGNENLSSYGTLGGYSIDNIISAYSISSSSYPVGKCTISEMIRRISIYDGSLEGISYNNTQIFLRYGNKTQEEILSLLANNELYYVLATPQYIHISQTDYPILRSQLENIYNNAKSYNGTTNITQTNEDLPFNISVDVKVKEV